MNEFNVEGQDHLRRGEITDAINDQVSPPRENCRLPSSTQPPNFNVPIVKDRPRMKHSIEKNQAICEQRAKLAKSRGINQLVVSFEGLATYNEFFVDKFYKYYDGLWEGKDVKPPGGTGSFVGKNLIAPHLKEDYKKADFLLMSERGGAKKIEDCAAEYRKVIGPDFKLKVMGLSFGAGEAVVLSRNLSKRTEFGPNGIEVEDLVTFDLRGSERKDGTGPRTKMNDNFITPANVKKHMNFGRFNAAEPMYVSPTLGYPGYRSKPSGVEGTSTTNVTMPVLSGHASQLKRPEIQNYYKNLL
jgi:hypothetical protein